MDPIVLAAATALVGAMATDVWQQSRAAVVACWRKLRPNEAAGVEAELETTQRKLLAARQSGDRDTEQTLTAMWQLRLQHLLEEDPPTVGAQLRHLLIEHLAPVLPTAEQARLQQTINAHAYGQSRQYIAGRDQHIGGT
ncbi:hypothetical protein ACIBKY_54590 [Nonomuraea sp. NPDC050394]|uniref:hypothetical protein n=1 Tax=Nonomuraea sp. NPDC050394 TaxID=3364363 RepID=UPI0037B2AB54